MEIVPAVYKEWGKFDTLTRKFKREPTWVEVFNNITRYQRKNESHETFVPNFGFEMEVFLHHIVKRYDSLSETTVFVQADVQHDLMYNIHCLQPNVLWTPLRGSKKPPFMTRCDFWNNKPYERVVWDCFNKYLRIFNETHRLHPPCPQFYIRDNFAVSRQNIRRFPRSVWVRALDVLRNHTCSDDLSIEKHVSAPGEFTSNFVFGNRGLFDRPLTMNEWKQKYDLDCLTDCLKVSLWPHVDYHCIPTRFIASSGLAWRLEDASLPQCWSRSHEGLVLCDASRTPL